MKKVTESEALEFQELFFKEMGKKLTYEEALDEAQNFYELFYLIVKP